MVKNLPDRLLFLICCTCRSPMSLVLIFVTPFTINSTYLYTSYRVNGRLWLECKISVYGTNADIRILHHVKLRTSKL